MKSKVKPKTKSQAKLRAETKSKDTQETKSVSPTHTFYDYDVWCNQFDLSFVYGTVMSAVAKIIDEASDEKIEQYTNEVYEIMKQWRDENGHPPSTKNGHLSLSGLLLGGSLDTELPEKERKERVSKLEPWECIKYYCTPIALFKHLLNSSYPSLETYLDNKWHDYFLIEAILLFSTHKEDQKSQSGDIVRYGVSLIASYASFQKKIGVIYRAEAAKGFTAKQIQDKNLQLGGIVSAQVRKEKTKEIDDTIYKYVEDYLISARNNGLDRSNIGVLAFATKNQFSEQIKQFYGQPYTEGTFKKKLEDAAAKYRAKKKALE
jgi:hypothetical protein